MRSLSSQNQVSAIASLALPLAVGIVGCASSPPKQAQELPVTAQVELGGQMIGLEVAQTRQAQAIGLMFRESLPEDRGMLFPVEPPRPVTFWMKNVEIPLDMLFIAAGEVIAIEANVPPCSEEPCPTYGPEAIPVDAVLEVQGGLTEELGVQVGDAIQVSTQED